MKVSLYLKCCFAIYRYHDWLFNYVHLLSLSVGIPSYSACLTVEQVFTADFSSSLCWVLWPKIKEFQ